MLAVEATPTGNGPEGRIAAKAEAVLPDAPQALATALGMDPHLAHFRYAIEARYVQCMCEAG